MLAQEWVHEMAAYLKEKDPNHLVTVGLEGFWGAHTQEALDYNPLPGEDGTLSWTSLTGQNFTAQHDSPHIDFCGAHYWPDLWVGPEPLTNHALQLFTRKGKTKWWSAEGCHTYRWHGLSHACVTSIQWKFLCHT